MYSININNSDIGISWIRIQINTDRYTNCFRNNIYNTWEILNWPSKKNIPKSFEVQAGKLEARIRNDHQAVFQIVRDLVQAQFNRGDEELTKRIWQDVADREIDLDGVINLMYTLHLSFSWRRLWNDQSGWDLSKDRFGWMN